MDNIVVGNHGGLFEVPVKEDPPQRDEVHTTPTRDQHRKTGKY